jgi:RNA polymerase sigma-70 factor (ECF subfamily)
MELATQQFEKLALEQIDTLYRVARRLTRDADRAGDLVQETYLRALRARDSFHLEKFGIRPWLLRIMQNLHYSRSDRERRQPISMDESALELNENTAAHESSNSGAFNFDQLDEQLARELDALPQEYQLVLLLWAVEDLSYKEIAHTLDIPIGTVMSRLHRVRQKLGERLKDYAVREGVIRE